MTTPTATRADAQAHGSDGVGARDPEALAAEIATHPHGRVPRDLRRRHLLAVAAELFAERGYQHVSMDELARRVGVSKPVVYDLVGSKDQLFQDVMAEVAEELAAAIAAAVAAEADPAARLEAGARAFFRFVGDRRDSWAALLKSDAAPVSKEVAAIRDRQHQLVIGLMTDAATELGTVPDRVWIEAAAHAVNGAFESLAIWWAYHDELTADDVAALLTALFAPGLAALGSGGPPA